MERITQAPHLSGQGSFRRINVNCHINRWQRHLSVQTSPVTFSICDNDCFCWTGVSDIKQQGVDESSLSGLFARLSGGRVAAELSCHEAETVKKSMFCRQHRHHRTCARLWRFFRHPYLLLINRCCRRRCATTDRCCGSCAAARDRQFERF